MIPESSEFSRDPCAIYRTISNGNRKVSYEEYIQFYQPEGCFYRKIEAIPSAFIFGVILPIFDSIGAIFFLAKMDVNSSITRLYDIFSHVQIGFGWLITLFDDRCGTYLVARGIVEREGEGVSSDRSIDAVNQIETELGEKIEQLGLVLEENNSASCEHVDVAVDYWLGAQVKNNGRNRDSLGSTGANTTFDKDSTFFDRDSSCSFEESAVDLTNYIENSSVLNGSLIQLSLKGGMNLSASMNSSFDSVVSSKKDSQLQMEKIYRFMLDHWPRAIVFIPENQTDHWLRDFKDFPCKGSEQEFNAFKQKLSSLEKTILVDSYADSFSVHSYMSTNWTKASGLIDNPKWGQKFYDLVLAQEVRTNIKETIVFTPEENKEIKNCLIEVIKIGKELQLFYQKIKQKKFDSQRASFEKSLKKLELHVSKWLPKYELALSHLTKS